jgi:RecA-family ATPase
MARQRHHPSLHHSIPNLPAGAYTRFGYTAAMHHNGDRSAFAKKLLQEGKALVPVTQPAITDNILINWQDFWTQSFPAEDWLIEPIIPRNQLVVIFAPGGTGKSLLALYIAAALATGKEIFAEPKPPTNVLYMDYEMSQAVLYERLTAMGYNGDTDLSRLHYASLPPIGSLDKPEGAKQICDLARTCQAELVIIDTFARAVEGAENDADTVRNFYRWTAMNLKQEGRSLMRIDHAGKDLKKGARGTSAKNDDVDLVWQMTKVDGQLVLIRQKHRHTWIPERINLIIHDQAQMFTQDIKGGERLGQAMKMLEELNIDPALSQDAMWTLVKDRAENIYKVSRKTTRLAHKQRKDQADENLLEDF